MTKAEIVKEIANKTGVDKQTVLAVIESFMTEVKGSLEKKRMFTFVALEVLS